MPVDGIVVAVEDKIILKSDVVLNMQMAGINLSQNSIQLENIYNDFLDQMINDYVLISAAEKDTNIVLDDNMVQLRLNEYMNNLINEVGSEEILSEMFNKSIREIKYYYQEQIYNAMLRETYVYTYVDGMDISRQEVELFYENYRDSIPVKPAEYTFSVIEIPLLPGTDEIERVQNFQNALIDSIDEGASFEDIAKKYSSDLGTAEYGGDQGYYKRGTLFEEFEDAAFRLNINEISSPIRTPIGFHIIQLLDKKDNQIHTRHILSLLKTTEKDKRIYKEKLDDIYTTTMNDPGMFDSLAVIYSEQLKNQSGVYINQNINQIDNYLKRIILNTKNYTLTSPILNNDEKKYVLVYLYETKNEYRPTTENSWGDIEKYAIMKKENDLLLKLITKLKHNTFIKYYN